MIKNNKQAAITKAKLEELQSELQKFEASQKEVLHPVRFQLGVNSYKGLIKDLQNQLAEYEDLTTNSSIEFSGYKLVDLAKIFIKTRLARQMSQKELADNLGILEQQIQRYESDDYSKAAWSRMLAVSRALELDIGLEKTIVNKPALVNVPKVKEASRYIYPRDIQREAVVKVSNRTKINKSLLFQS